MLCLWKLLDPKMKSCDFEQCVGAQREPLLSVRLEGQKKKYFFFSSDFFDLASIK